MQHPEQEFVLTHYITNLGKLLSFTCHSRSEEHFGILWKMTFGLEKETLKFKFGCRVHERMPSWAMDTEMVFKLTPNSTYEGDPNLTTVIRRCFERGMQQTIGYIDIATWPNIQKFYKDDNKIKVECFVKIRKLYGFQREIIRYFDDSVELYDVILIVENQRFHVMKQVLAVQSSYFKALFLGNFNESSQSEVVLRDVCAEDFQNFLELIHGESSVDDRTVNGILHLANMYDAPTATRRCEEFLLEKSERTLSEKLYIANQYWLEILIDKCISDVDEVEDVESIMTENFHDLDISIAESLIHKMIKYHEIASSKY